MRCRRVCFSLSPSLSLSHPLSPEAPSRSHPGASLSFSQVEPPLLTSSLSRSCEVQAVSPFLSHFRHASYPSPSSEGRLFLHLSRVFFPFPVEAAVHGCPPLAVTLAHPCSRVRLSSSGWLLPFPLEERRHAYPPLSDSPCPILVTLSLAPERSRPSVFPARRLLPSFQILLPPSMLPLAVPPSSATPTSVSRCRPIRMGVRCSLPSQEHDRRYLRAQHVHRSILAHLRSCQAGPIPAVVPLPCPVRVRVRSHYTLPHDE